jgi:hypothetical protein
VAWADFPTVSDRLCVGSLQGYGRVPCTQQQKYLSQDDDLRLASGAEMRLIEAEALLAKSDANWPQAMQLVNGVRTSVTSTTTGEALAPWTASSAAEAWTILKRERGIELWLEARRFADLRRWQPLFGEGFTTQAWPRGGDGGVQGHPELPDFPSVMNNKTNNIFTTNLRGRPAVRDESYPRQLCYNISNTERNTNPNIADDDEG